MGRNEFLDCPLKLFTVLLDQRLTDIVDFLVSYFRPLFKSIQVPIRWLLRLFQEILTRAPPLLILPITSMMTLQVEGKIAFYCLIYLE